MRGVLVGRRSDQSSPVIRPRSAFSGPVVPGPLCYDASCEYSRDDYQKPFAGESIDVNGVVLLFQGSF